ncbi:MAG: hypothetical protein LUG86_09455 [Oscillospiraceae bacterium]|nr:hypothetical protein [Oscillospiraceae bacterium]
MKDMLGINARVEDLREQIIKDINRAQMPACILDYVLTEILNDVRAQRMNEVQKERRKYREEMTPAPGEAPVPKREDTPKDAPAPGKEDVSIRKKGGGADGGDDHAGS